MNPDAMKRFIDYLLEQKREDDLEKRAMRSALEELSANFNDISEKLSTALDELCSVRNELKVSNKKALKFEELYNRAMRELYGSGQKKNST